jgi:hypothetical protein
MFFIIIGHGLEYFFIVRAGVNVTSPSVHGMAVGLEVHMFYRLAKCKVRVSPLGAELDNNARPKVFHEPKRERRMTEPE